MQGLGESFRSICSNYGIQTYFKSNRTLKDILVSPKVKMTPGIKSGTVYWCRCQVLNCNDEYIISQDIWRKIQKNILKCHLPYMYTLPPLAAPHHTGELQYSRQERQDFARKIKESIFKRVNNPTLNTNIEQN